MVGNGDGPGPTPLRWQIILSYTPTRRGVDGLNVVMFPVARLVNFLERAGMGDTFSLYVGTLDAREPWLDVENDDI
jgi:hypothetical protein